MNLYSTHRSMLDCKDDVQLLALTDACTLTRCSTVFASVYAHVYVYCRSRPYLCAFLHAYLKVPLVQEASRDAFLLQGTACQHEHLGWSYDITGLD